MKGCPIQFHLGKQQVPDCSRCVFLLLQTWIMQLTVCSFCWGSAESSFFS
jgi:hypothetical protein